MENWVSAASMLLEKIMYIAEAFLEVSLRQESGQVHDKVKERIRQGKSKVKARSRGKFNNSNSFNEYRINFYRWQLTPYEQLQQ